MEKVIQEWRVVETDDGFRIEITGDKEQMRKWVHRLACRRQFRWPGHRRHFGAWGPWHMGCGPDQQDEDEADEE